MPVLKLHGKEYVYGLTEFDSALAEELEAMWGGTYGEWIEALGKGSMRATRLLVWICKAQHGEKVRVTDIQYKINELETELTDAEKAEEAKAVKAKKANPTRGGETSAT